MHIEVAILSSDINCNDYETMVLEGGPVRAASPGFIINHFVHNFEECKF